VRRIGSDFTSGDECSRSEARYINKAEQVSQIATLHHPCTLLPATTGVQSISGAQARCTSRTLPSCLTAAGLPAATLPPPASSAAAARFAQTKTPR